MVDEKTNESVEADASATEQEQDLIGSLTARIAAHEATIEKLHGEKRLLEKEAKKVSQYEGLVRTGINKFKSLVDPAIVEQIKDLPLVKQHSILETLAGKSFTLSPNTETEEQEDNGVTTTQPSIPRPEMASYLTPYQQERKKLVDEGKATAEALAKLASKYRGKQ